MSFVSLRRRAIKLIKILTLVRTWAWCETNRSWIFWPLCEPSYPTILCSFSCSVWLSIYLSRLGWPLWLTLLFALLSSSENREGLSYALIKCQLRCGFRNGWCNFRIRDDRLSCTIVPPNLAFSRFYKILYFTKAFKDNHYRRFILFNSELVKKALIDTYILFGRYWTLVHKIYCNWQPFVFYICLYYMLINKLTNNILVDLNIILIY